MMVSPSSLSISPAGGHSTHLKSLLACLRWVVHTCNDIYKLEPPVKEDTVKAGALVEAETTSFQAKASGIELHLRAPKAFGA